MAGDLIIKKRRFVRIAPTCRIAVILIDTSMDYPVGL